MSSIDLETNAVVARFALEDLEALYGRRWGKSRVDSTPSDEELALRLQAEQFQQWITVAEDVVMGNSLHEATEIDAAYLEAYTISEQAAIDDRRAALALSRGEPLPCPTACQIRLEDPTFTLHPALDSGPLQKSHNGKLRDFSAQGSGDDDDEGDDDDDDASSIITLKNHQFAIAHNGKIQKSFSTPFMAGPSLSVNASNRSTPLSKNCVVCDDRVFNNNALHTPCGHYYCHGCAVDLVQAFTRDESLFPLRCCQTAIPTNYIDRFIPLRLKNTFDAKNTEWSILAKDRIYCCNPACSAFLGSSVEKMHLVGIPCIASGCRTSTCPRCKQVAHPNELDCSANRAMEEVWALARQEGWQTCPGCHTIVELQVGCYHMTCRCRTQFCYVCAMPWKRCTCPQWDEGRLLVTAEHRLENQIGAREMEMQRDNAPQQLAQTVRQVAENLRENHNCASHNWKYRTGGGRCEECHSWLPKFLLICKGCSLLACVRCSRNRL